MRADRIAQITSASELNEVIALIQTDFCASYWLKDQLADIQANKRDLLDIKYDVELLNAVLTAKHNLVEQQANLSL